MPCEIIGCEGTREGVTLTVVVSWQKNNWYRMHIRDDTINCWRPIRWVMGRDGEWYEDFERPSRVGIIEEWALPNAKKGIARVRENIMARARDGQVPILVQRLDEISEALDALIASRRLVD